MLSTLQTATNKIQSLWKKKHKSPVPQYSVTQSVHCALNVQQALDENFSEPFLCKNKLKRECAFEEMKFCSGSNVILSSPNAGGNSINSEALSFDVLNTMFGAKLKETEMELEYFPLNSKITDFSVSINDVTYGVSVTRAMKYSGTFTFKDAHRLLTKKLQGVNESSIAVLPKYQWDKQILHVLAENERTANIILRCYETLPAQLRNNTIVIVTVCDDAPWVFYERACK